MFKQRNFTLLSTKWAHFKFDACYRSQKSVLWAKAHLKWTVSKWKSVLWSDKSKFDILVGNHGRRVLRAKEEGDLPACHQHFWWYGVHKCIRYGQLACFGRHYECWNVYKGLEQHMLPSRQRVFQQDNAKPHTAAITTAWLRSRRVQVLNWPAWSPYLSPIENIWRIVKWKIHQKSYSDGISITWGNFSGPFYRR